MTTQPPNLTTAETETSQPSAATAGTGPDTAVATETFWAALDLSPLDLVNAIAAIAAVLVALLAIRYARQAAEYQLRAATAFENASIRNQQMEVFSVHARFQERMRELQSRLPANVNEPDWSPSHAEKRIVRLYWYAVFDEWLAAKHMGLDAAWLWDDLYRHGVKGALALPAFSKEFDEMIDGEVTFLGRLDFIDEVKKLRVG
jgi:hypothetical protein